MARFTTLRVAARSGPPPLLVAPVLALAAVGALVIVPLLALAAIPVVVTILVAIGWVLACGLGLWVLIEGLAAFERWIESDSRFQQ